MLFRVIATVASVAFIAQGALAQLTIEQVVTSIGTLTTVSGQAANRVESTTLSANPSDVTNTAQVSGLHLARDGY
jgi:hypothetical protein